MDQHSGAAPTEPTVDLRALIECLQSSQAAPAIQDQVQLDLLAAAYKQVAALQQTQQKPTDSQRWELLLEGATLRSIARLGLSWGDSGCVDARFHSLLQNVHTTLADLRQQRRQCMQSLIGEVSPPTGFANTRAADEQAQQLLNRNAALDAELQRLGLPSDQGRLPPRVASPPISGHNLNANNVQLAAAELRRLRAAQEQQQQQQHVRATAGAQLSRLKPLDENITSNRNDDRPLKNGHRPPSSSMFWQVAEEVESMSCSRGPLRSEGISQRERVQQSQGTESQEVSPPSSDSRAASKELWKSTAPNYVVKNTFVEPADFESPKARISAGHFFSEQPRRRPVDQES